MCMRVCVWTSGLILHCLCGIVWADDLLGISADLCCCGSGSGNPSLDHRTAHGRKAEVSQHAAFNHLSRALCLGVG